MTTPTQSLSVEEAADAYESSLPPLKYDTDDINVWYSSYQIEQAFIAGHDFAMQSDKVKGLVEALEKINKKAPHDVYREEAADMACEFKLIATQAIKEWKK